MIQQKLPLVCQFLKTKSLQDLKDQFAIDHTIDNHKVSLNYDQIASKKGCKLTQECRGLIITPIELKGPVVPNEPLGNTRVLARSFDRFFNYGDTECARIDFLDPTTRFYEKLDGTLCMLYYDDIGSKWCLGTRKVPEANLPIKYHSKGITFRDLFLSALENFDLITTKLSRRSTYMFELTAPDNQILVKHTEPKATLIGVRDRDTGEEADPIWEAKMISIPGPTLYCISPIKSLQELIEEISKKDPLSFEGIVVCDRNFNRVKLKTPPYLALSRLKNKLLSSDRNITALVLSGTLKDHIFEILPEELGNRAKELQEGLKRATEKYERIYQESWEAASKEHTYGSREHRKAFALHAKDHFNLGSLFYRYDLEENVSFMDYVNNNKNLNGEWTSSFLDRITSILDHS